MTPLALALPLPMPSIPERGRVLLANAGTAHLGPGEWAVGSAPGRIETLLGSCVCITLWHPFERVGAACHFVLPVPRDGMGEGDPRYGSVALECLLGQLRRVGIAPRACVAKVFGGGRMFDQDGADIGTRNAVFAMTLLESKQIPVGAGDVGRAGRRRLRFDLATGEVWVRFDRSAAVLPLQRTDD